MDGFFKNKQGESLFLIGLQTHNSSSTCNAMLDQSISAVKQFGGNVLEAPVYWCDVEPTEQVYDFTMVRNLLNKARSENLYLILLWFATSKNGHPNYTPEYIKTNPNQYKLAVGPTGAPVPSLSPHCTASKEADCRAFSEFMRFLKREDEAIGTVLAVQIENEMGLANTDRDYGSLAVADYEKPVPDILLGVRLDDCGICSGEPTWRGTFGRHAHEAFNAWYHGLYAGAVATAGKAVYDLPIITNVMVGEQGVEEAGFSYNGGAAVGRVINIWKQAAPDIDLLCPDIYNQDKESYTRICSLYNRSDNDLFIPESSPAGLSNALNIIRAVANYHAIGICCFGAESTLRNDGTLTDASKPVALSMRTLAGIAPILIKYRKTGNIHALIQEEFMNQQYLRLDHYHVLAKYFSTDGDRWWLGSKINLRNPENASILNERGRAILIQTDEHEFFLAGAGVHVEFIKRPDPEDEQPYQKLTSRMSGQLNFLTVEEGHFEGENWVVDYYRNGDEANGLVYVHEGQVVRIRLNPFTGYETIE